MTTTSTQKVREWRHRTGRHKPRQAPPGNDPGWCAAHEAELWDSAEHGARQAAGFARRVWGVWIDPGTDDFNDLVAVGLMRLCVVSAHPARDARPWRATVARYAAQSYIKQHIIGAAKPAPARALVQPEPVAVPDNCSELVAALRSTYPGPHWVWWKRHIPETASTVRELVGASTPEE